MKRKIISLLSLALIIVMVMGTSAPALTKGSIDWDKFPEPEEFSVEVVEDGVVIKWSGFPSLADAIEAGNLNADLANVVICSNVLIQKSLQQKQYSSDEEYTLSLYQLTMGEFSGFRQYEERLIEYDVMLGYVPASDDTREFLYVLVNGMSKKCFYLHISQNSEQIFFSYGDGIATSAKSYIDRYFIDREKVEYYDIDIFWMKDYSYILIDKEYVDYL